MNYQRGSSNWQIHFSPHKLGCNFKSIKCNKFQSFTPSVPFLECFTKQHAVNSPIAVYYSSTPQINDRYLYSVSTQFWTKDKQILYSILFQLPRYITQIPINITFNLGWVQLFFIDNKNYCVNLYHKSFKHPLLIGIVINVGILYDLINCFINLIICHRLQRKY